MAKALENKGNQEPEEEPDERHIRYSGDFYGRIQRLKERSDSDEEVRRKKFNLRAGIEVT